MLLATTRTVIRIACLFANVAAKTGGVPKDAMRQIANSRSRLIGQTQRNRSISSVSDAAMWHIRVGKQSYRSRTGIQKGAHI
jgi:hypothetical protein